MKIEYGFIEEHELLIHRYIGNADPVLFDAFLSEARKKDFWGKQKRLLTDVREIIFPNGSADLFKFAEVTRKYVNFSYINVHLVDKPLVTALVHLYHDLNANPGAGYVYCSTIEHAIENLALELSVRQVEDYMNKLQEFRI